MNNNELVNDFDEPNYEDEDQPSLDDLIEEYRYSQVEYVDWDKFVIEEWEERLAELGYTDAKIMYSGFCSQGDGAGFESGYDIDKFIDKNKPLIIQWLFPQIKDGIDDLKNYLTISIKHTGGQYCHKHSFALSVEAYYGEPDFITQEKLEEISDYLQDVLEAERLDLCGQIYKDLWADYDYLTSDEGVTEYLINNGLWEEPETEVEAEPMRQAA